MDRIFEKLYEAHIEEEQENFSIIESNLIKKEYDVYLELFESLSGAQKKLLSEFSTVRDERFERETKKAYIKGFKTAIRLMAESSKEE